MTWNHQQKELTRCLQLKMELRITRRSLSSGIFSALQINHMKILKTKLDKINEKSGRNFGHYSFFKSFQKL